MPPGGGLLDSTTVVLPRLKHIHEKNSPETTLQKHLVVSGVVLGLGHRVPGLETDLKPGFG